VPTSTFWLNQRTARTQSGSAFSATTTYAFTYKSKGELVLSENDTITAREFGYNYDAIGNRISAYVGSASVTSTLKRRICRRGF
jgi:hypothetical protein